jgi:hypothetical protein
MPPDGVMHRAAPILRAQAFARAIGAATRRLRPPVAIRRRAGVTTAGNPERVPLVLVEPIRSITHQRWHSRTTQALRWDIRITVPGEPRTLTHRRDLTHAPDPLHLVTQAIPVRAQEPAPDRRPTRLMALVQRAGVAQSAAEPTDPGGTAPDPVAAAVRGGPANRVRNGPLAVPIVHRQPSGTSSTNPDHRSQPAPPAMSPLAARWDDRSGPAGQRAAAPLTVQDMPVVIDRVVREIDRRVVAARERRGWSG